MKKTEEIKLVDRLGREFSVEVDSKIVDEGCPVIYHEVIYQLAPSTGPGCPTYVEIVQPAFIG